MKNKILLLADLNLLTKRRSFALKSTCNDYSKTIQNLETNKANCRDQISSRMLNVCRSICMNPVFLIFQYSFSSARFSSQ